MDGVPMSYQLWNNYLIRNPNYWEKIQHETTPEEF